MPADFRRAVFDTWVKAGWSKARLCGGGIAETHTGKLLALKPPALAATDNGPAIEAHFGKGVWTAHTPNVARCSAYAKHYLARGCHASLYHRADRLHLIEHQAAYDQIIAACGITRAGGQDSSPVAPPTSPETPGAVSFRYTGGRLRDVAWSPQIDRRGWPIKSVSGKDCNGLLYGCAVGGEPKKIEWIKCTAGSAHTVNAWGGSGEKYGQNFRAGLRVLVQVRDINGRLRDTAHAGEVTLG
jgi:hypothetical protein